MSRISPHRSGTWYKDGSEWKAKKTITIPAVPLDAKVLPPLLAGFGAVPPLVTDIGLSLDDHYPLRRLLGHR